MSTITTEMLSVSAHLLMPRDLRVPFTYSIYLSPKPYIISQFPKFSQFILAQYNAPVHAYTATMYSLV